MALPLHEVGAMLSSEGKRTIAALSVFVVGALASTCTGSSTTPSTTSIVITGNTTLTAVGQTTQLAASQAISTGGTSQDVTSLASWTSSSTDIATVSTAGLVTAVAPGVATVTASYQGQSGSLSISVSPAAAPAPSGPATYHYTGNLLTNFTSGDSCPPACQITGSFTVAAPLAASLASAAPAIQSFTFTDGNTTVTQANGQVTRALVSTDANGQITLPWVFEVQTTTPGGVVMLWAIDQLQTQGGASDGSAFISGAAGSAFNLMIPGTWSH